METKKITQELYNGAVKIEFSEGRHTYRLAGEKDYLISVTAATGIIDKSPALMGWVAKMMGLYLLREAEQGNNTITEDLIWRAKSEYRRVQQQAADIGTEIHEWASDWIKGKKPELPEDEKVLNGVTAFLKFQKKHKIKWIESEKMVYSRKHKFVGTLDGVGVIDGKLILLDFKSSNAIYPEMSLQVAGYQIAYEEETGKKIDGRMIIRFGKNTGDFEVVELEGYEADKKTFLACLTIKKRLKEIKKNGF